MEDPEPEAVLLPVVNGLPNVLPGLLLRKRLAITERVFITSGSVWRRWMSMKSDSESGSPTRRGVVMVARALVMVLFYLTVAGFGTIAAGLAQEIVDDMQTALDQFSVYVEELRG